MSKTTAEKPIVEWNQINWRKLEKTVFKLQKRIYQASTRGDVKTVRKLQRTLMRSWSAKCLAVRRVSQDNQGKKTAGVDGVKTLTPKQRLELINQLRLSRKAKPTRRVWIPKPGREEKRPLGIPTMADRASQALVKLALEPQWEAVFEPNSFGFRPGRSAHDAIAAIYLSINKKSKFILDADISKCFDKINHKTLLEKLNAAPHVRRKIRAWLKAGVMDGSQYLQTKEGTPQGGVISPLLANIALHGMEQRMEEFARTLPGNKRVNVQALTFVRYADDFVLMHKDQNVILKGKEIITEWLSEMGLELKNSKTRICHTLHKCDEEEPGFDFLGFNIRQYKVGKYNSGKSTNGQHLGFKTFIKPSLYANQKHHENIAEIISKHKAVKQAALISKLNPVIRGWCNYYSTVVSKEEYSRQDNLMWSNIKSWAFRRHPNKSRTWSVNNYWHSHQGNNWTFATRDRDGNISMRLIRHSETPIVRHIKVQENRSPYDGDWVYWGKRMSSHPGISPRIQKLLKTQKGKCNWCGLHFKDTDVVEIDHIIPKSQGGLDEYKNLQLLHRHCHDCKTAKDNTTQVMNEGWLDANPF